MVTEPLVELGSSSPVRMRRNVDLPAPLAEYLEEYEIRSLIRKYSDYIRYPIKMEVTKSRPVEEPKDENAEGEENKAPKYESYTEMETLNSMVPIWQRDKKDVTEEEYETFYRDKFFDYNKPLRTIHYNVEGNVSSRRCCISPARRLTISTRSDYKRGLQLYSSGVLIMDNCEDLLPEHFRFVRGVVDSQDLSLNISREMLQHNRQLTIIARNIEKKIKSELKAMLENDREKYEEFYAAFGRQLKYGTVSRLRRTQGSDPGSAAVLQPQAGQAGLPSRSMWTPWPRVRRRSTMLPAKIRSV